MTEKDLRRLGRKELIELIYEMKKRELELQTRLDEAEAKLAERTVNIEKAGSIADAAVYLSGLLESAQKAADIYIESVKKNYEDSEMSKKNTSKKQKRKNQKKSRK